jgi:hypothetical protein
MGEMDVTVPDGQHEPEPGARVALITARRVAAPDALERRLYDGAAVYCCTSADTAHPSGSTWRVLLRRVDDGFEPADADDASCPECGAPGQVVSEIRSWERPAAVAVATAQPPAAGGQQGARAGCAPHGITWEQVRECPADQLQEGDTFVNPGIGTAFWTRLDGSVCGVGWAAELDGTAWTVLRRDGEQITGRSHEGRESTARIPAGCTVLRVEYGPEAAAARAVLIEAARNAVLRRSGTGRPGSDWELPDDGGGPLYRGAPNAALLSANGEGTSYQVHVYGPDRRELLRRSFKGLDAALRNGKAWANSDPSAARPGEPTTARTLRHPSRATLARSTGSPGGAPPGAEPPNPAAAAAPASAATPIDAAITYSGRGCQLAGECVIVTAADGTNHQLRLGELARELRRWACVPRVMLSTSITGDITGPVVARLEVRLGSSGVWVEFDYDRTPTGDGQPRGFRQRRGEAWTDFPDGGRSRHRFGPRSTSR